MNNDFRMDIPPTVYSTSYLKEILTDIRNKSPGTFKKKVEKYLTPYVLSCNPTNNNDNYYYFNSNNHENNNFKLIFY